MNKNINNFKERKHQIKTTKHKNKQATIQETMAPFKPMDKDSDATTLLLRPWMQMLIDKHTSVCHSRLRLPQRNIVDARVQRDSNEEGVYYTVRIWLLKRVYKYNIYGVVRDSVNFQLSCV